MKTILKSVLLISIITLSSCKKESAKIDYVYSDKDAVLECANIDNTLMSEAVYSFEKDLQEFYTKGRPNLLRAYQTFLTKSQSKGVKIEDIVSKHTVDIFNALKEDSNLWNLTSSTSFVNYDSEAIKCIAKNMNESNIKATFNSLLSVNSVRPEIMAAPIRNQTARLIKDKKMATYVALEYYYGRMHDLDFSTIDFKKREEESAAAAKTFEEAKRQQDNAKTAPFNPSANDSDKNYTIKKTTTPKADPHAGHNHN